MVALNVGAKAHKLELDVSGLLADGQTLKPLYGRAKATVEGGRLALNLPGREAVVLGA